MSTATIEQTKQRPTAPPRPRLRDLPRESWAGDVEEHFRTGLPGFLAYEALAVEPGRIEARMELRDDLLMAAGDFVHAGTVVAFADSLAATAARSPTSAAPSTCWRRSAERSASGWA